MYFILLIYIFYITNLYQLTKFEEFDLVCMLNEKGFVDEQIYAAIDRLKKEGDIFEPRKGTFVFDLDFFAIAQFFVSE